MSNEDDNTDGKGNGKKDGKVIPFRKKNGSEGKTKESRNLTPSGRKLDLEHNHRDREIYAEQVLTRFNAWAAKLKEMRPEIETIQQLFHDHVENTRGAVKLCGCNSFKEFCEEKLHRTKQAVYAMLGDYDERKKKKQRVPKMPEPLGGPLDTEEKREAAVLALDALNRFEIGKTQQERDAAWAEYKRIKEDGEVLKSTIQGDHPNPRLVISELLDLMEQNVAMMQKIVNGGLIAADQWLTDATVACADKTSRYCRATRKRFNLPASQVN